MNPEFDNWLDANGFDNETIKLRKQRKNESDDNYKRWIRNTVKKMLFYKIQKMIDKFGEDGFGDKKPEMDTCLYWLSHIDYTQFIQSLVN
jgi:hypothetical protein